jgi:hypothetical protein
MKRIRNDEEDKKRKYFAFLLSDCHKGILDFVQTLQKKKEFLNKIFFFQNKKALAEFALLLNCKSNLFGDASDCL